jgi:hypothetical protein
MGATVKKLTLEPCTKILSTSETDSSLIAVGKSVTLKDCKTEDTVVFLILAIKKLHSYHNNIN